MAFHTVAELFTSYIQFIALLAKLDVGWPDWTFLRWPHVANLDWFEWTSSGVVIDFRLYFLFVTASLPLGMTALFLFLFHPLRVKIWGCALFLGSELLLVGIQWWVLVGDTGRQGALGGVWFGVGVLLCALVAWGGWARARRSLRAREMWSKRTRGKRQQPGHTTDILTLDEGEERWGDPTWRRADTVDVETRPITRPASTLSLRSIPSTTTALSRVVVVRVPSPGGEVSSSVASCDDSGDGDQSSDDWARPSPRRVQVKSPRCADVSVFSQDQPAREARQSLEGLLHEAARRVDEPFTRVEGGPEADHRPVRFEIPDSSTRDNDIPDEVDGGTIELRDLPSTASSRPFPVPNMGSPRRGGGGGSGWVEDEGAVSQPSESFLMRRLPTGRSGPRSTYTGRSLPGRAQSSLRCRTAAPQTGFRRGLVSVWGLVQTYDADVADLLNQLTVEEYRAYVFRLVHQDIVPRAVFSALLSVVCYAALWIALWLLKWRAVGVGTAIVAGILAIGFSIGFVLMLTERGREMLFAGKSLAKNLFLQGVLIGLNVCFSPIVIAVLSAFNCRSFYCGSGSHFASSWTAAAGATACVGCGSGYTSWCPASTLSALCPSSTEWRLQTQPSVSCTDAIRTLWPAAVLSFITYVCGVPYVFYSMIRLSEEVLREMPVHSTEGTPVNKLWAQRVFVSSNAVKDLYDAFRYPWRYYRLGWFGFKFVLVVVANFPSYGLPVGVAVWGMFLLSSAHAGMLLAYRPFMNKWEMTLAGSTAICCALDAALATVALWVPNRLPAASVISVAGINVVIILVASVFAFRSRHDGQYAIHTEMVAAEEYARVRVGLTESELEDKLTQLAIRDVQEVWRIAGVKAVALNRVTRAVRRLSIAVTPSPRPPEEGDDKFDIPNNEGPSSASALGVDPFGLTVVSPAATLNPLSPSAWGPGTPTAPLSPLSPGSPFPVSPSFDTGAMPLEDAQDIASQLVRQVSWHDLPEIELNGTQRDHLQREGEMSSKQEWCDYKLDDTVMTRLTGLFLCMGGLVFVGTVLVWNPLAFERLATVEPLHSWFHGKGEVEVSSTTSAQALTLSHHYDGRYQTPPRSHVDFASFAEHCCCARQEAVEIWTCDDGALWHHDRGSSQSIGTRDVCGQTMGDPCTITRNASLASWVADCLSPATANMW